MKPQILAIVIPYYKIAFFEATLQSLANQTDKRFKVYIGDDDSLESPSRLVENYKEGFDLVYHLFDNNLGGTSLTQQWERCIALANEEEWVMILGDDDVLGSNVVEAFYENLEEIKLVSNVVRFASCKMDSEGSETSSIYHNPKIGNSSDILFKGTRSSLSEYVFNKKQKVNIGFNDFPLAWFADVLAVLEFSKFETVFSINDAVVYVRISSLSISGNHSNEKLKLKAKFDFYYHLLNDRFIFFSNQEQIELWNRLNKCYFNNKKDFLLFWKISKLYFKKESLKVYFLFIWRAISTYKIKN